jgi:hypothetical protein
LIIQTAAGKCAGWKLAAGPVEQGYTKNYSAALEAAAEWPANKLYATLRILLRENDQTESTWGIIDALTDLLNKNGQ